MCPKFPLGGLWRSMVTLQKKSHKRSHGLGGFQRFVLQSHTFDESFYCGFQCLEK